MANVTIKDLKELAGVKDEQLDKECSDEHFYRISMDVGNHTLFAGRFMLKEAEKTNANMQPTAQQKAEEVFRIWKRNNIGKATYRRFVEVCLELRNGELARTMCNLCREGNSIMYHT